MAKIQVTQNGKILVTQNGGVLLGNTSELATKTITENGTYLASTDNVDGYSEVIVNVSGSSSGTTDVPLTRISDDNGNEIGTHYMNFEDANGNLFKVVCLDTRYRNDSTDWCSNGGTVTNMPIYYDNLSAWWYDNAKETATQNTQLILDYCSVKGYTSGACSHCRSQSFTINGTTYYGQLPNMREVFDMWRHRVQIQQMDTSASSSSWTNFSMAHSIWSSNQYSSSYGWYLQTVGHISGFDKSMHELSVPVLEIPA